MQDDRHLSRCVGAPHEQVVYGRRAILETHVARGDARVLARLQSRHGASRIRRGSWRGGRLSDTAELGGIRVSDHRRRSLGRRLARAMLSGSREDTVLSETQATDRDRGHRKDHDRYDERLTPVVVHGVHSMRRVDVADTIKYGRPTKPSGRGSS